MVIHSNMSPKVIGDIWIVTKDVFIKYNIPLTKQKLRTLVVEEEKLTSLLLELNDTVGSSTATCIEGG